MIVGKNLEFNKDSWIHIYIRVFHHFFKHILAEPNRAYNFIAVSVPQIQNFRKFGPKLKLLRAKNKLKQPNTADQPILVTPQPSRAELEQPQFWSDFSEILDLRFWNRFKTSGSVWLCLKKWWNTPIDMGFYYLYLGNSGVEKSFFNRLYFAYMLRLW